MGAAQRQYGPATTLSVMIKHLTHVLLDNAICQCHYLTHCSAAPVASRLGRSGPAHAQAHHLALAPAERVIPIAEGAGAVDVFKSYGLEAMASGFAQHSMQATTMCFEAAVSSAPVPLLLHSVGRSHFISAAAETGVRFCRPLLTAKTGEANSAASTDSAAACF